MANDLINASGSLPAVPVTQQAEKITNIEQVGTLHQTNQIYLVNSGILGVPGSTPVSVSLSRNYYNLIVWGSEPFFEQRHVTISEDRALVGITPELKKLYQ